MKTFRLHHLISAIAYTTLVMLWLGCNEQQQKASASGKLIEPNMNPTAVTNNKILKHNFLVVMYEDSYYPKKLVDRCKEILLDVCAKIEATQPQDLEALYRITHEAANRINKLEDDFVKAGSEIETVAREDIAENMLFIANTYGFDNADIEELIATRNW